MPSCSHFHCTNAPAPLSGAIFHKKDFGILPRLGQSCSPKEQGVNAAGQPVEVACFAFMPAFAAAMARG
jgi:hypothetical protein